jgi:glycosyltransferase involved in cell wall biosynthesis
LNTLETEIKPDIVFTIFAPTYWRPKTTHIVGFALGWITNPQSKAYQVLNFKQKIRRKLDSLYKIYYIKRDADYYIVETEDVKEKLFTVLNIEKEKTFIIGNTYSEYFEDDIYPIIKLPIKEENEFRFVTIAHNYPHKNIKVIKEVIPYLQETKLNYKFFITIDEESYNSMFEGLEHNIINIGQVKAKYCPSLYAQCDALFLPTLLESFTASYPEAMKMQKPILTSDLSFAHSLCKDAALYFDPLDPQDIAEKIIKLSTDNELQRNLVKKGIERLKDFETAESRARKYLNICQQILRIKSKI